LKLRVLPSVALELVSSTAVSRGVDKGGEHTEKASDSPPSWLLSIRASSKSWDRREGRYGGGEGGEEAKGEVRHQKISVGPIGKLTSYIGNLLACFGIEASIPRPTTSPKGPRLLLFDY
jgi:hypothetical protein